MPAVKCALSALRYCLNYLYKPRMLRASPLLDALGLAQQPDGVARLRDMLVQVIDSLKPTDAGAGSPLWRDYEILYYRYVQHCSQAEVASQLGLSIRHLKREQQRALDALAERLQQHYGVIFEYDGIEVEEPTSDQGFPSLTQAELQWLRESTPDRACRLSESFPEILALIMPMTQKYGVTIEATGIDALPPLAVHAIALRHILLSLLGIAIRQSPGVSVSILGRQRDGWIEIEIRQLSASQEVSLGADDAASLAVARSLLHAVGGSLQATQDTVRLTFPAAGHIRVLVVDDNADLIYLLERYTAGTRYLVVGETRPEHVFTTVEKVTPRVIILDVMMPQMDGWELLGRLRQHPSTHDTPIVACTILAQEELAFSLGVSAYLRKPITREALLTVLDQVLSAPATASPPTS